MDHFATFAFHLIGVDYAAGDSLDALDARTLGHLRVAGWATAVPSAP